VGIISAFSKWFERKKKELENDNIDSHLYQRLACICSGKTNAKSIDNISDLVDSTLAKNKVSSSEKRVEDTYDIDFLVDKTLRKKITYYRQGKPVYKENDFVFCNVGSSSKEPIVKLNAATYSKSKLKEKIRSDSRRISVKKRFLMSCGMRAEVEKLSSSVKLPLRKFLTVLLSVLLVFVTIASASLFSLPVGSDPGVLSVSLDPSSVYVNDSMFINATIPSYYNITSVTIDMNGYDKLQLSLIDNSTENYIWKTTWNVTDVEPGNYLATFTAFDKNNTVYSAKLDWIVLLKENINATNDTAQDIDQTNISTDQDSNLTSENETDFDNQIDDSIDDTNITEEIENETLVKTKQLDGVINQPVKWTKEIRFVNKENQTKEFVYNISIPFYAKQIKVVDKKRPIFDEKIITDYANETIIKINETLDSNETKTVYINYTTPEPESTETIISSTKKRVVISSDIHYTNISAFTTIDNRPEDKIHLYHIVNDNRIEVDFTAVDMNNDKLIDRIEWIVPHLSEQVYEIIIEITKAEHLDENRIFISDIYEEVRELDGIWSERIPSGDYVRVTFERKLTSSGDITVYARNNQGLNTIIEVYYVNSSEKITEFPVIKETKYYKILLTNMTVSHDIFDLRVKNLDNNTNAYLEFDHIIDPPASAHGFKVYQGSFEFDNAKGTSHTENIGATVDTDHAFLMVYTAGTQDSPGARLPERGSCYGYISNTTQVTFTRETAGNGLWVSWFVIECFNNEFTVRGRGAIELAATVTSNTSSVSGVSDSSQCIVAYGGHSCDGTVNTDWEDAFCNVHLTASDTVTAKRHSASDDTKTTIRYEVVEWSSDYTIYTGETTVSSSEVTALISGSGNPDDAIIDMDRSWMIANWWTPNNGIQQVQNYYNISNTNQITIGSYSGTYNNLVRWYVIEFPSGDDACSVQRFSYNWDPTTAPNNVRNNTIPSPVNTSRTFIRMSCSISGTGTAFRRDFNLPRLTTSTNWTETQYNPTAANYDQHETRTSVIELPYNTLPTQSGVRPANGSIGVNLIPQLNVTVDDTDKDTLNVTWWSNSSGPWVQFASNLSIDVSSGAVNIIRTNSNFSSHSKTYYWSVNLTDGIIWINETYQFTTSYPPQLSNPNPANGSATAITPICSIFVSDPDGGTVTVRFYENSSNGWVLQQTNSSVDVASPAKVEWDNYSNASGVGQKYWWKVNVSDGKGCYAEDIYHFTTSTGNPPILSYENPIDLSTGIPTSLSTINVTITDDDGDNMDWTIETSPDIGSNSGNNEGNGSKACSVSGLNIGTTYYWFVNVTDGVIDVNETYKFTTNYLPQLTGENPTNESTDVSISITTINVTITDADSDTMNWTIETSPNIGSNSGNDNISGDNISCTVSGLNTGTTYYWYVNVTDGKTGETWTNETYYFTTANNPPTIELINPSPNGTTGVSTVPLCQIWANDTDGDTLTVYWYENTTGDWVLRNTNISISANSPVNYTFTQFNNYFITYWWKVAVNDSTDNATEWYYFITEPLDTSVDPITPYNVTTSPFTITATNNTSVDNVSLWYRYSSDNSSISWGRIGEVRDLTNVGDTWTTLNFWNKYTSPVVVSTYNLASSSNNEAVVRISNVTSTSCDIRIQNPGDDHPVTAGDVYVIVMEEGAHNLSDGTKVEAYTYNESTTAENNNWAVGTSQTYSNSYTNPVVLGQVMSQNDTDWSVFWCSNGVATNPPDSSNLYTSKHVGEDTDIIRNEETLGYIVIEQGSGANNGINYRAELGGDTIEGVLTGGAPYTYSLSGTYSVGVSTLNAMDGTDGGFAVLYGASPIGNSIGLAIDEDTIGDVDRSHATEQVAYWVFDSEGNITSDEVPTWQIWNNVNNPDENSPWGWEFNFPNETGYYEFYSAGNKSGSPNETAPGSADAICHWIENTSITASPTQWDIGATTVGSYNYSTTDFYFNLTNEGNVALNIQIKASNATNMTTGARWNLTSTPSFNNYSLQYNKSGGSSWTNINTTYDTFVTNLGVDSWQAFDLNMFMATTSSTGDPLSLDVTFKSVAS